MQPENAYSPILVTLFGIIVLLHPTINILVVVSIIALQLFLESYTLLPLSTSMLVKLLQLENAVCPILMTLFFYFSLFLLSMVLKGIPL